MSAVLANPEKILIDDETIRSAQAAKIESSATLIARSADGTQIEISEPVRQLFEQTLSAVARHGSVSIGTVPAELTSTVAADILGVSRPTLMKWATERKIDSFKVGTHTRFDRDEVFRVRETRRSERREAFDELRELDMEHVDDVDGGLRP